MPIDVVSISGGAISEGISGFIVTMLIGFLEGALIGFEREKAKVDTAHDEHYKGDFPGIRTFSMISIMGCLSGALLSGGIEVPPQVASYFFLFSVVFIITLALFFALYRFFRVGFVGMTTYLVMPLTFMIGILTGLGYLLESLSLTFITSGILSLKRVSVKLIEKLSYDEYAAGLELGLVVFVLGPLIYAVNPKVAGLPLWNAYLFFVVVLLVSYTSYLSYKAIGSRSLGVISILGGLVNSEATFTAVSKFVGSSSEATRYFLYIVLGVGIRGLSVVGLGSLTFLGSGGAPAFLRVFVPGCLLLMLSAALLMRRYRAGPANRGEVVIKSPLEFSSAARAALIYVGIFVLTKLATHLSVPYLLHVVSFVGGLASAIATAFSLLSNYPAIPPEQIAVGSLLATVGALVNKIAYARASAHPEFAGEVARASLILSAVLLAYVALAALALR